MKFNETEVLSRIVPVRDLKPGVALCANIPFAKDVKACITNPRFQIIKNNLRACISLSIEKLNTKYSVVAFRCFEMGPGKLPESVPGLTDILNLPSSKENNQTELNHHENPKSKDE
nr:PREDICTED: uncharacterized protein LOC100880711 [Megachile rotundata]